MKILKKEVKSVCPVCKGIIFGKIVSQNGKVYIIKKCKSHGSFKFLVEKNESFYKACKDQPYNKLRQYRLDLPISHRCNMNCKYCYFPKRDKDELSLNKLKKIIREFSGDVISFSGGEPTLREDLPQLIRYTIKMNKIPTLTTNGLKLSNEKYLKSLKKAGLRIIHFSLEGWFDEGEYSKSKQSEIKSQKGKALKNIMKNNMFIMLSFLLKRGRNEKYLKDALILALNLKSHIHELRIRSANMIGRYENMEVYNTSEIMSLLSDLIGEKKTNLINALKNEKKAKCVCKFGANFLFIRDNKFNSGLKINRRILLKDNYLGFDMSQKTGDLTNYAKISKLSPKGLSLIHIFERLFVLKRINVLYNSYKSGRGFKNSLFRLLPFYPKKLMALNIQIRAWPNKCNVDLDDVINCPSMGLSKNENKILPFCYRFFSDKDPKEIEMKK